MTEPQGIREEIYPIGKNDLWHGGVHVQGDNVIRPLTNGSIIAVRLNKDPIQVDLPKKISLHDYSHTLSGEEQDLYKTEELSSGLHICVLKDESAENKQNFSNSFVLIKHSATIPTETPKTFNFFSLYTNIVPPYGLLEPENTYLDSFKMVSELKESASAKIPLYLRWLFKTNNSIKIYDTNTIEDGNPTGNVVKTLTISTEFEFVNPEDFLRNPRVGFHTVKWEDSIRYLYIKEQAHLASFQAKISTKDNYTKTNEVITLNESISENDYLGYPGKQSGWSQYDCAVFTKDLSFMDETKHHTIPWYVIPKDTMIYFMEEKVSQESIISHQEQC